MSEHVCATCNKDIPDMGDAVEAQDKLFHNECFCVPCNGECIGQIIVKERN